MKKQKTIKSISAIIIAMMLILTQVFSVSALYKKAYELDKDELLNEAWSYYEQRNIKYTSDIMPEEVAFSASLARYEMKNYLKDYTPLNKDVTVSDVANDFSEYLGQKYADITIDVDENDNIYEIDSNGNRYDWKYDSESDDFVCTDSNGKVIKTYDRYHTEAELATKPTTKVTNPIATQNSEIQEYKQEAVELTNPPEETTLSATEDTAIDSNSDSGMSTTQIIILSVIGVAIIGGCVGLVYMIIKKKK